MSTRPSIAVRTAIVHICIAAGQRQCWAERPTMRTALSWSKATRCRTF